MASKKKATKASVSPEEQAQDVVARQEPVREAQSIPNQPRQEQTRSMSSNDELGTIIEFSEDISTAEAPPPLPVREYRAQVKGAKAKMSQRDTTYAEILFYISPEEYPADFTEGDPDGMTIAFRRCSLEDKPAARFAVRKLCEALGAPRSKRIDLNEWIGLEASVKVEHETYEGITRGVITKVNSL